MQVYMQYHRHQDKICYSCLVGALKFWDAEVPGLLYLVSERNEKNTRISN